MRAEMLVMEDRRKAMPDDEAIEDTQIRTVTSVDLGEDLLETTQALQGAAPVDESNGATGSSGRRAFTPEEITDQMASVRILLNEGLLDEAKRILRGIVLSQPSHVSARKKLEEVHALELKHIFGESHRSSRAIKREPLPTRAESEEVMRVLDRDLNLGVFGDGDAGESAAMEIRLFGSQTAMEEFGVKLDRDLRACMPRDRMDIGIAFLEMGLFELAGRQFRVSGREPNLAPASIALLAFSLIQSGRPFEATLSLEPPLADPEVPRHQKLDVMYLMGRAHERLRKPELALRFYEGVREIDPHYRDVDDRRKIPLVQPSRKK